jgi:hypothetical protein
VVGVVPEPHALGAGPPQVHVADRDAGDVPRGVGRAHVDELVVLGLPLNAVLESGDGVDVGGELDVLQRLLPVDGETVERVVAVVDVEDAPDAVEDSLATPAHLGAHLRALDHDRGAEAAADDGPRLFAVLPGGEVDARSGGCLVQGGLDGAQRRCGGAVVGVVARGVDVQLDPKGRKNVVEKPAQVRRNHLEKALRRRGRRVGGRLRLHNRAGKEHRRYQSSGRQDLHDCTSPRSVSSYERIHVLIASVSRRPHLHAGGVELSGRARMMTTVGARPITHFC